MTGILPVSGPNRLRRLAWSFLTPSGAASTACRTPATAPWVIAASVLAKPMATSPDLCAIASASRAAASISRSVSAMKSAPTRMSRLKPRAKTLRATAMRSASRDAVIHRPRPGSRRLRSGTGSPAGEMTNRIISATGFTAPVTAQKRSAPGAVRRGPVSSSSFCASASIVSPSVFSGLCRGRLSFRLNLGGFLGGGGRRQILFLDPAGLDARLHDQCLDVLARQVEAFECSGMLGDLAVLALGPAGKIVCGTASQLLDCLDAVLAELHEFRRGGAGHFLERIRDAELLALGIELGLLSF